jgi:hypothetical protein
MSTLLMGVRYAPSLKNYWSIASLAGEGPLMTFFPDPRKIPAASEVLQRQGYRA